MEIGSKWECDYLPGKTLKITKVYSDRMAVVNVEGTDQNIVCAKDLHSEPHLCLAHVFKGTEMKRKQGEIKWK